MAPDPDDLDALIGEIRLQAARRRASPAFPLEEEAALEGLLGAGEVDRLARLADEIRRWEPPSRRLRPAWRSRAQDLGLARLSAAGFDLIASRLSDIEARLRPVHGVRTTPTVPGRAATAGTEAMWGDRLARLRPAEGGPTLVAAADPAAWFAFFDDADGLAPGSPAAGEGRVRHGDIVDHLARMGEASLALTVLAEPFSRPGGDRVEAVVAALAEASRVVAVVSVAPWHWAATSDPVHADLEVARPLSPETWIALMAGAGMEVAAEYAPGATSYLVVARRGDGPVEGAGSGS